MTRRTRRAANLVVRTSVLLVVLTLAGGVTAAVPTDLDPGFGAGGVVTTDLGGTDDEARGVAVQPDGRIVVAGGRNAGPDFDDDDYILVRYLPGGGLDPSFGTAGRVVTDFGGPRDSARDVVLQPDGKILAAGWSHDPGAAGNVSLARYLPNGALDPSFDGDGRVVVDLGGDDFADAVGLQADGRIVVAGGTAARAAVLRLHPDGSLDTSFSGDGKVLVDLGVGSGDSSVARAVAVTPGGTIVIGGARCNPSCFDIAAARLRPDGSLDVTFGGDGIAQIDVFTPNDSAAALAVAGDGSVVLAGVAGTDGALARLRPDGEADPTFGVGGRVRVRRVLGETLSFSDVELLPSGRILVGGAAIGPGGSFGDLLLARFLPDGGHDVGFSDDGRALVDVGGRHQFGAALALQPDGKALVAGLDIPGSFDVTATDIVVARFLPDGSTLPLPPGRIRADQSDFGIVGVEGVGIRVENIHSGDLVVGDFGSTAPAGCNGGRRSILRFDLGALRGGALREARLTLTLTQTRRDQFPAPGTIDSTPPFVNPGLGALRVIHIADQPMPVVDAYAAPSIGNDPGTLVAAEAEAGAQVSVDITPALRQALAARATFASFRVETELETDGDCLNDTFGFWSGDGPAAETRPFVDYELSDVTPPTITAPTAVDVDATAPEGAVVAFELKVEDDTDPSPDVTCVPASGSIFPIGDTAVRCVATDATGNSSTATVLVHVRGAPEQLERLRARVSAHRALEATLATAHHALERAQAHVVCRVLGAFERQLAATEPPEGASLAAAAARIGAVLDCRAPPRPSVRPT